MSVTALPGTLSASQIAAFRASDLAVVNAINHARAEGVPLGLIVAMLHGHAHVQTAAMVNGD